MIDDIQEGMCEAYTRLRSQAGTVAMWGGDPHTFNIQPRPCHIPEAGGCADDSITTQSNNRDIDVAEIRTASLKFVYSDSSSDRSSLVTPTTLMAQSGGGVVNSTSAGTFLLILPGQARKELNSYLEPSE